MSHSVIHVTYGSKPQIGKTSVAHTAAQTEPGEQCADPSEGLGHRLGTMRDGCERQFDLRLEELLTSNLSTTTTTAICVIVQSAEHAARTFLSFRTCQVVDGGTQWTVHATECRRRESEVSGPAEGSL